MQVAKRIGVHTGFVLLGEWLNVLSRLYESARVG